MSSRTPITKLKSIQFGTPAFRKLRDIAIPVANRITVIAGHNGLGKSTILGLIANASGITKAKHKSYFDRNYTAPIEDVFFLSPEYDYKEDRNAKPNVTITYESEGQAIIKRCNVTKNDDLARLRVHPRTVTFSDGKEKVGSAAKLPIPTIYVGMSRMFPIGENDDSGIERKGSKVHKDDIAYINQCFSNILGIDIQDPTALEAYTIKGIKKSSRVPDLGIDTLAISLGQDSVSVLVTALASFRKIKREMADDYPGGILAIDEIEAGLHPHAQIKLVHLLKKEARNLDLQIIATSHSLTVIKEIFATQNESVDAVRYFINSSRPILLTDASYLRIKNDMLSNPLLTSDAAPAQKFYFEDDESRFFFTELLAAFNVDLELEYGIRLKLISTKLGCDHLFHMATADNDFNSIVIVFDNDVLTSETNRMLIRDNKNFLALPGDKEFGPSTQGTLRTPEAIAFHFLERLVREAESDAYSEFWYKATQTTGYSTDSARVICTEFTEGRYDRDKNKALFRKHLEFFKASGLIRLWGTENADHTNTMITEVGAAIKYCAHLRPKRS